MLSFTEQHRGSVLVAVLAILFLATAMIFRFVDEAVQELHYRGQVQEDPELEQTAYSAFESVLAVLHEFKTIDGKIVAPAQGWSDPLDYAGIDLPEGYSVDVWFIDETGKLSINELNEDRLPLFFEELGLDFSQSNALTDTLLDWIDADDLARLNGAEADVYQRYEPAYRAANRRIQTWDEFRLIEGFRELFFDETGAPNAYFERWTASVSLYHDKPVNINTANGLVLSFVSRIEGFDPRLVEDHLAGDDGIPGTADDNILFNADNGYYKPPEDERIRLGGMEASILNIKLWCRRGASEILIDALVDLSGNAGEGLPFRIVSLSENQRIG